MTKICVKPIENKSGTSVKFKITHLQGEHYGAKIYYRDSSDILPCDWQQTEVTHPITLYTKLTVSGLSPNKLYDFYPVTVTENGEESEPGNFIRLRVSSADRISLLSYAIADELSWHLPPQNIFIGARDKAASDPSAPVAVIFEEGISRKPLFNTLSLLVVKFRIAISYDSLDKDRRNSRLNALLDTLAEKFATDLSMFSSVEGYYDTQLVKCEYAKERDGEVSSTASLVLECLIKS